MGQRVNSLSKLYIIKGLVNAKLKKFKKFKLLDPKLCDLAINRLKIWKTALVYVAKY